MDSFLTAWHFLTAIPLPWRGSGQTDRLASSLTYYPFVGVLMGGLLVLGSILCAPFFPKSVTDLLVLFLLILLSGGIHLDGLADTVDGFSGGARKEEILEIMRDGRVGSIAVMALFFVLAGKLLLLNQLKGSEESMALLAMPALGRWSMVLASYLAPYARQEGLGKEIIGKVSTRSLGIASGVLAILLLATFRTRGLVLFFLAALGAVFLIRMLSRRIDGMTGDTVGAVGELSELLFLFLVVGMPRGL